MVSLEQKVDLKRAKFSKKKKKKEEEATSGAQGPPSK